MRAPQRLMLMGRRTGPRTFLFLNDALPPGATIIRASAGGYFGSAGALQSAANDVPRFTYDPTTLALQGLLVEPARTNSVRNNTAFDTVAGSPGTLPTVWSLVGSTSTTRTLAVATESGIEALQITFAGNAGSPSSAIQYSPNTGIPALVGQTWTASMFLKLLSGGFTNVGTAVLDIDELDAGGSAIAGTNSRISVKGITAAALRTQKFTLTRTLTSPSTAYIRARLFFSHTSGTAVNFGIAVGLPQMEQGDAASSPIKTTSAAVTRAADVLSLALVDGTYDIDITRASGVTNVIGAVVSGGSYTVPTDLSPLQNVVARRVG